MIVDCCSIKDYPKHVLFERVPKGLPILLTHPMFGPNSAGVNKNQKWSNLKMMYDKSLLKGKNHMNKVNKYLSLFKDRDCVLVEMSSSEHD